MVLVSRPQSDAIFSVTSGPPEVGPPGARGSPRKGPRVNASTRFCRLLLQVANAKTCAGLAAVLAMVGFGTFNPFLVAVRVLFVMTACEADALEFQANRYSTSPVPSAQHASRSSNIASLVATFQNARWHVASLGREVRIVWARSGAMRSRS